MAGRKEDHWSRFAETFDEDQSYVVGKAIQRALTEKLSGEQNLGEVVEFGCGRVYYTPALANNSKRVVATNLSNEMLEMAPKQLKAFQNITFQKAAYRHSHPDCPQFMEAAGNPAHIRTA